MRSIRLKLHLLSFYCATCISICVIHIDANSIAIRRKFHNQSSKCKYFIWSRVFGLCIYACWELFSKPICWITRCASHNIQHVYLNSVLCFIFCFLFYVCRTPFNLPNPYTLPCIVNGIRRTPNVRVSFEIFNVDLKWKP